MDVPRFLELIPEPAPSPECRTTSPQTDLKERFVYTEVGIYKRKQEKKEKKNSTKKAIKKTGKRPKKKKKKLFS